MNAHIFREALDTFEDQEYRIIESEVLSLSEVGSDLLEEVVEGYLAIVKNRKRSRVYGFLCIPLISLCVWAVQIEMNYGLAEQIAGLWLSLSVGVGGFLIIGAKEEHKWQNNLEVRLTPSLKRLIRTLSKVDNDKKLLWLLSLKSCLQTESDSITSEIVSSILDILSGIERQHYATLPSLYQQAIFGLLQEHSRFMLWGSGENGSVSGVPSSPYDEQICIAVLELYGRVAENRYMPLLNDLAKPSFEPSFREACRVQSSAVKILHSLEQ